MGAAGCAQTARHEAASGKVDVTLTAVSDEDKPRFGVHGFKDVEPLGLFLAHGAVALLAQDCRLEHSPEVAGEQPGLDDAGLEKLAAGLRLHDLRPRCQEGHLAPKSPEQRPGAWDGAVRELGPAAAEVPYPEGHVDVREHVQWPLPEGHRLAAEVRQQPFPEAAVGDRAVHEAQEVDAVPRGANRALELDQLLARGAADQVVEQPLLGLQPHVGVAREPLHQRPGQPSAGGHAEAGKRRRERPEQRAPVLVARPGAQH
mmetsp:Transcript_81214/g.224812  ORF Transcript_81214/g.224812 Transcript_81214/m.224812 type:complete len:259 (+) Transcript_81214:527-1303(+)